MPSLVSGQWRQSQRAMGRQLKQNMLGKRKYTGPFENVAMNRWYAGRSVSF